MTPTEPGRIIIIGAGPTGLGAAYRLSELGVDNYLLLEAGDRPGGLSRSYVDARGFTWDIGGHVQFSHYDYYDRVLDAALLDEWLWHERESWIRIKGRYVPYPFQNNLHRLDPADRADALAGLERARLIDGRVPPGNLAEWIDATFGAGIAGLFMRPYNLKVWAHPLEQLDAGWIGDRVAVPDVERIKRNISDGRDDVSWGPNRRFRFPSSGGTGAIWEGVARRLPAGRAVYGARVTGVDLSRRIVQLDGGQSHPFDFLLSTMPLDLLCELAVPLPGPVNHAARSLRHSSVHVLGVGLRGSQPDELATKCWMYFPETTVPYFRVTVFSNYSRRNAPSGEGHWSLMAEVSESTHKAVDANTLPAATLKALSGDSLMPAGAEVISLWHRRFEHGYPTPFLGRDDILDQIVPTLEASGVFPRGRFGGWKYEVSNQDHSFMQGVEWADFVVRGGEEITIRDPQRANSGVFLQVRQ
jgi:protoporphyrinogen oxidase